MKRAYKKKQKTSDLQIFQLGQVSEGAFFNKPQTVDVLHWATGNISVITILLSVAVNKQAVGKNTPHSYVSCSKSQGLYTPLHNDRLILWNLKEMQIIYQLLQWVIAFIIFEWDMWRRVKCDLHLCQAVEGEEGVCLYMCDAVALGDLAVAKRIK